MGRQRSMVAPDKVRPTQHQIKENLLVVPRAFWEQHRSDVDWQNFTLVAFGVRREHRSLDRDHRIGVPLQGHVRAGDAVRLEATAGVVYVSLAASD